MKKLISIILTASMILFTTIAIADVDISDLSFDELVALKDKINLAIWNSQEWKEVTVPQGEWVVGEDIPAGVWTIKCVDYPEMFVCHFEWGFLEDGEISFSDGGGYGFVYNPNYTYYEKGNTTEMRVELKEGMSFKVDYDDAPAVFTPYTGKPSLGFD